MTKEEEWLPVVGFEGLYDVSSMGRIASRRRVGTDGRVLKGIVDQRGYPYVNLYRNGIRRHRKVHILVVEAFIGPRPDGQEVRHLDGDASNSVLSNLTYGTKAENEDDKRLHSAARQGVLTQAQRLSYCSRGHKYTSASTRVDPARPNVRLCRVCARINSWRRGKPAGWSAA